MIFVSTVKSDVQVERFKYLSYPHPFTTYNKQQSVNWMLAGLCAAQQSLTSMDVMYRKATFH